MFRDVVSLLTAAFLAAAFSGSASAESVSVMYAGSLVNLMEHGVAPAFGKATGDTLQGVAGGSNGLANQIKAQQRHGDVFISADPKVNDDLKGAANGDWVNWYVTFAQSPLVIGYNPSSRFASELKTKPWYEVLEDPGIRIGRTDPSLDPKGALTVQLLDRAERIYKLPGLAQKVLGSPDNPAQVRAEENLVTRLESGAIDVGFFYSTETADRKIASMTLPSDIALSAHYSVTVLRDAPQPTGAVAFVAFLLGPQGQAIMREHGLETVKPSVSGDLGKVPAPIRSAIDAAK
jgi:molybdate/tungstate transport system substrate-binding protein